MAQRGTTNVRSWRSAVAGSVELAPEGLDVLHPGQVQGPMFGGTIAQLVASLGTPFAFSPPEGCVLFLEDVNERPYRIDRMLTQLRLSGILSRARALVFGDAWVRRAQRHSDREGSDRASDRFPGPVLFGFPSGHTSGPCWTPSVWMRVESAPRPCVVIEEPAVARSIPTLSDWRLRNCHGNAGGAAQEPRPSYWGSISRCIRR